MEVTVQHDPIDRALPQTPGTSPKIAPNVSVVPPEPSNGGSVKISGTGTERAVVDVPGPFKFEVPRQRRDA
jgi:hypothetical protein